MLVTATALLLAACGESPGNSKTEVIIGAGSTTFTVANAPYTTLPQALGFWKDEGLDVKVNGFQDGGTAVQAVVSGKANIAFPSLGTISRASEKGAKLKAFYNQYNNGFVPEVPEGSNIQRLADFEGKTVGVIGLDSSGTLMLRGAMTAEGSDPGKVKWVAVGDAATAYTFLQQGRIDAAALYDSAYGEIEFRGIKLRPIGPEWFKRLSLQQVGVSSEDYFKKHQDEIVRVLRGIAKATIFAEENPEAAIRIHWKIVPASKPVGVSDEAAMDQAKRVLAARNALTAKDNGQLGGASEEQLKAVDDFMKKAGIVPASFDLAALYDNSLFKEVNNFDAEKIREKARNYKVE
ncbi:ABC transporter substrate-binding protein [Dactylosporangium sp. CA-233914]|uniref:ABC transporter substrate-binding protein n=1 Tax=Dactylosporangium sp. CA-233914 TaxID=3239934 RepID=UPI003D8FF0DD